MKSLNMNGPFRKLTLLGLPPSAFRFNGKLQKLALSPRSQILATLKDQSETICSSSPRVQSCIVYQDESELKWSFNYKNIIARSVIDNKDAAVLAAPGGLFRVDVGQGSRFLCNPSKIVGIQGDLKASIVYNETRLDIFNAWSRWFIGGTARFVSAIATKTKQLLHKIPAPQRFQNINFLHTPRLPTNYSKFMLRTRFKFQKYRSWLSDKLFTVVHPPKIEVRGPCSLLIKP